MSLFEKFLLQAISAQRVLTLFSGMKRSPSPLPSPPGRGRILPTVGKCSRLGGTACRGPCYQGRQHAVPPPWRGRNGERVSERASRGNRNVPVRRFLLALSLASLALLGADA